MHSGLTIQQQSIIPIAAFAANGDTDKLKSALEDGLSAGLSVNEIKEVLIQLSAYAGFPRSLTALNVFLDLLEARKASGIKDNNRAGAPRDTGGCGQAGTRNKNPDRACGAFRDRPDI